MKDFRSTIYPSAGPSSNETYIFLWDAFFFLPPSTIVAASKMLTNYIYSLYTDVLYKVDKTSFTKYFKRKEISNL